VSVIYSNDRVRIEVEPHEIPWLKVFAQQPCKEFSDCDADTRQEILLLLDVIERAMLDYFQPDKINIASFGNYVPQVHWHVMARFQNDSYFPEPVWGLKQRDSERSPADMAPFIRQLLARLTSASDFRL
jgi:diadenosine tetraphosphate (Ap4A) HIT family hydrolase